MLHQIYTAASLSAKSQKVLVDWADLSLGAFHWLLPAGEILIQSFKPLMFFLICYEVLYFSKKLLQKYEHMVHTENTFPRNSKVH